MAKKRDPKPKQIDTKKKARKELRVMLTRTCGSIGYRNTIVVFANTGG